MKSLKSPKYRKFAEGMANMVVQDEDGNFHAVGPNAHEIRFLTNEKGYMEIERRNNKMSVGWYAHEFVVENIGSVSSGINSKAQESRPLKQSEQVHHIDGDPSNNRPENLIIMDEEKHMKYHYRVDLYASYIYGIPMEEFIETFSGEKRVRKKVIEEYRAAHNAKKIRAFMDQQNVHKFELETQQRQITLEIYKAAFDANQAYKCYKNSLEKLKKLKEKK